MVAERQLPLPELSCAGRVSACELHSSEQCEPKMRMQSVR